MAYDIITSYEWVRMWTFWLSLRVFLGESFLAFLLYHGFVKTRVERCRLLKNYVSKSIMLTINIIDSVLSILLWVYCLKE